MFTIQDAAEAYRASQFIRARAIATDLAVQGDPNAQFLLGLMHARGEGGDVDLTAAATHYSIAARAGHPSAKLAVGKMCAAGAGGLPKDIGVAAHWFFQAWQAGEDSAEREIIRIRAEVEAAAEAGSAEAQNVLGLLICFGHDDPAAAAHWLELAAAQNHPEALRTLGYLHDGGKGVPQDDVRAAEYYRRAAELGDAFAQFNFAVMMDQARGGLTPDRAVARGWYRRAAEQGFPDAEQRLAELAAEE